MDDRPPDARRGIPGIYDARFGNGLPFGNHDVPGCAEFSAEATVAVLGLFGSIDGGGVYALG